MLCRVRKSTHQRLNEGPLDAKPPIPPNSHEQHHSVRPRWQWTSGNTDCRLVFLQEGHKGLGSGQTLHMLPVHQNFHETVCSRHAEPLSHVLMSSSGRLLMSMPGGVQRKACQQMHSSQAPMSLTCRDISSIHTASLLGPCCLHSGFALPFGQSLKAR